MNLRNFVHRTAQRVQIDGIHGFAWPLITAYRYFIVQKMSFHPYHWRGTNVYDRDWDALIVLDACRPDLLREVSDEFSFIESVDIILSMGTNSNEWLRRTFIKGYAAEIKQTVHVTANPFTEKTLKSDDFLRLAEVWKYGFNEQLGTIPARPVTDRAIRYGRELSPERIIVHYMQPHFPSVPINDLGAKLKIGDKLEGEWEDSIWSRLRSGYIDKERVWEAYRENLRYVLDDVELLLRNLDAPNAVITADHGNAIGEYGFYGHPRDTPLRCLREVPWLETTARDIGDYEPSTDLERTAVIDRTDQLNALGYLD